MQGSGDSSVCNNVLFYSVYDGAEDKESAKKQFQEALKELEKSICKEW